MNSWPNSLCHFGACLLLLLLLGASTQFSSAASLGKNEDGTQGLASSLFTWAGSVVQCIKAQSQKVPLDSDCQCKGPPAGESQAVSPEDVRGLLQNGLSVLYVIDPNFHLCWEEIPLDSFTRDTLVRYAYNLRDPLTATHENPKGDYLKVRASTPCLEL
jgi:hypothetical protein